MNIMCGSGIRENEPMNRHTTFRTGGPAEMYAEPESAEDLAALVAEARRKNISVFILGGGANLLVADSGIKGLVINTCRLNKCETEDGYYLRAGAGLPVSEAAVRAAGEGLAGLDFIYAMPGSVGGAVWMNARCYGISVSGALESVSFLEKDSSHICKKDWKDGEFMAAFTYKRSAFQPGGALENAIILEAVFRLKPGNRNEIWENMRRIEEDRRAKGHFLAPSAGSVFKNNRAHGEPAGKILDKLGFRNFTLGGAKVSPLHANIIINEGNASSADIRGLIEIMQKRAAEELGLRLEPEIVYAGNW
jgi:UDP-N-acetylmuramate dehydrogenase